MSGRVWLGLLFLLLGFGFLLHQADVIDMGSLLAAWWPLILVVIGVIQLFDRNQSSKVPGILFLLIGSFFLVSEWLTLNLTDYFWPFLLILIGFIIIFSRSKGKKESYTGEEMNTVVLLSGAEIKSQSNPFQGGSVTAILGGAEIDLRDAVITEGAVLDLTTIMGGVSILVPEHVQVELSGTPILGGWEDSTRVTGEEEAVTVLKINCLTILGGAEIKN